MAARPRLQSQPGDLKTGVVLGRFFGFAVINVTRLMLAGAPQGAVAAAGGDTSPDAAHAAAAGAASSHGSIRGGEKDDCL